MQLDFLMQVTLQLVVDKAGRVQGFLTNFSTLPKVTNNTALNFPKAKLHQKQGQDLVNFLSS